jgi:DNA-binding transcriptional MerR regulator
MTVAEESTSQPAATGPDAGASQATASEPTTDGLARIDEVAARTGLTKRTLRYYEEIGLLDPPTRTEGGYRLYTAADVQRLERIKRLKSLLGFSLAEIRDLVRAEEERQQVRAAWQRETNLQARLTHLDEAEMLVRRELRMVEEKLAGLEEMRHTLRDRLARYDHLRAEIHREMPPHA